MTGSFQILAKPCFNTSPLCPYELSRPVMYQEKVDFFGGGSGPFREKVDFLVQHCLPVCCAPGADPAWPFTEKLTSKQKELPPRPPGYGPAHSFFLHEKVFPILLDYCGLHFILLKKWSPADPPPPRPEGKSCT